MAAIEYGLIMATLVAAAAVGLPLLKDQLGAVANTTRNEYLEVGLPRIPDSMSALLGTGSSGVASNGTTQQTFNPEDDLIGSRRYYNSDEYTYGEVDDGSPTDTDGDGLADDEDTDDDDDERGFQAAAVRHRGDHDRPDDDEYQLHGIIVPVQLWQAGHQNRFRPSSSVVSTGEPQIRQGSPARR